MERLTCAGVLCDLDGTLIDSGHAVDGAWTRFAEEIGRDPAEILAMCHGVRTIEVMAGLNLDLPLEETALRVESWLVDAGSSPIPGAVDFLKSLPLDAWAIVTSSLGPTAASRFENTELIKPNHIVAGMDVERGKPDPAGFLLGAQLLGLAASDCVVFEDAAPGVDAGKAAGAKTVALLTTNPYEVMSHADYVIRDMTGVTLVDAIHDGNAGWSLTFEFDVVAGD